ncbi:hypothetical protein UK23_32715 [Lentzea aerocolonigenes]|uniref:Uncharacterized protein n=1 Tax=Lentzea aerocolonigenes TaxID=68170 RepID=A0A0F0GJP1_LENAE|nr:hypothetical protein UK23_32715 [Lentzea aerocolonigenes]
MGSIVVVAIVLLGAVAAVVGAHYATKPPSPPTNFPAPTLEIVTGSGTPTQDENLLAVAPMLQLPAQAAQPQAMTAGSAGPVLAIARPTISVNRWIPGGFPDTPEGALGQLKALNETALASADPQVYARGYRELSEPGAPDPGSTGLAALLRSMRSRAQLPATGSVAGLTASYLVTHGQVKGAVPASHYVVVCVLGQLSIGFNGEVAAAGVGDCQAMRWSGTEWRIASGALAAAAPCAWPGSADMVKAGYRELS